MRQDSKNKAIINKVSRQTHTHTLGFFDDLEPDWREYWWGMPEFSNGDATPQHSIVVNFMTRADYHEFTKQLGVELTSSTHSMWYPPQARLRGLEFYYAGPKTDSLYPICIPSKGRAKYQTTGKVLAQMGVSFRFFVEETEADEYMEQLGEDCIVSMPFHDLGKGSIPARNFIWEWCREREYRRHWTVDDNIKSFCRLNHNRRLRVCGGGFFRAMEDFVDRYDNIRMAGPHEQGFAPDRYGNYLTPCLFNSRVYSCILLDTTMDLRWRGKYNEDTDLSLRILKQGDCTALFRALLMDKGTTSAGGALSKSKSKAMKGGNTEHVYNSNDYRKRFAESLRDQHPDCVKVVWRFHRWHHLVDYSKFARNQPILRKDVTPIPENNEYQMELVHKQSDHKDTTCAQEKPVRKRVPSGMRRRRS